MNRLESIKNAIARGHAFRAGHEARKLVTESRPPEERMLARYLAELSLQIYLEEAQLPWNRMRGGSR